jgi:hypothetical protein
VGEVAGHFLEHLHSHDVLQVVNRGDGPLSISHGTFVIVELDRGPER